MVWRGQFFSSVDWSAVAVTNVLLCLARCGLGPIQGVARRCGIDLGCSESRSLPDWRGPGPGLFLLLGAEMAGLCGWEMEHATGRSEWWGEELDGSASHHGCFLCLESTKEHGLFLSLCPLLLDYGPIVGSTVGRTYCVH